MSTERGAGKDFSGIYKHKDLPKGFIGKKKQNKYHYTNIDLAKRPLGQAAIIEEISRTHDIDKKIVQRVLVSYQDIIKREVLFNGRFKIPGILEIYSKLWNYKHDKIERVPGIEPAVYICPPTTLRPKVKINKYLREDYKWARRYEEAITFKIDPEDWYKPFIIEEPEWIEESRERMKQWYQETFGNTAPWSKKKENEEEQKGE